MGKKDKGKQGQFWTGAEDTPLFCGTPGRADDPGRFEPEPAARQARLFGRDTVEGLAEEQRRARARKRRLQGQEAPEDAGPLFGGQDEDEGTAEDAETPDAGQDADPVYVCPQCGEPMDGACQCAPCPECEELPLDCNCPGLTPVAFQELQEGDRIRRVEGDGPIWIVQCVIGADKWQPFEIGITDGKIDNFQSWEWIFAPDAGQWERV